MESAGMRLRWARTNAGFKTAKAAAKAANVGEVSFRAYENDQHGYANHAAKFAKAFGVDLAWLLEGEGDPDGESGNQHINENIEVELIKKVDISYAMGDGSLIEDFPDVEYLPFNLNFLRQLTRSDISALFLATGQGDSMEPTLRRDDMIMIDTSQQHVLQQDQVWALTYGGAGMIKRVRKHPTGEVSLLSDNPSVPQLDVNGQDIHIVGKVVWIARVMA